MGVTLILLTITVRVQSRGALLNAIKEGTKIILRSLLSHFRKR